MNQSRDLYLSEYPTKILNKAELYSKTLDCFHELPKQDRNSLVVRTKAENEKDDIDFTIKMSAYQQHLFRDKQSRDSHTRENYRTKLKQQDQKIDDNRKNIDKKVEKKIQAYEKHIKEVYKRYEDSEQHKRRNEKEEAYKLRKELQDFYQKEKERKSQNQRLQVQVGTCYQEAVARINRIHQKNQEYAQKAELTLEADLSRNNKYPQRISRKQRVVSEINSKKPRVYHQSLGILNERHRHFIQTCGKNEDSYLNAWTKIEKNFGQMRKKRGEQTKKQLEKWRDNKRRVDESKAEVPEKCLSILDKTSKAEFRRTASSFRSTATKFQELVQEHKRAIYSGDVRKRNNIMDLHQDMTLKNNATAKMTQKMHSMRQHAQKIADDFL